MISEWIDHQAGCQPDAVFLQDARGTGTGGTGVPGDGAVTYAGLRRAALTWARRLDSAGLPPGTPVAIRLDDPVEYATALVAVIAAGRVAVPLDPGAPPADLVRVLDVARARAAISHGAFGIANLVLLEPEAETDAPPAGRSGPGSYGAAGGGIYLCTSGTTGVPKGILLRDAQLAHVAASVVAHHRLSAADRGYCSLPLFHVNAEVVGVLATLCAGACLAVDRKFSRRGFWEMIARLGITWINAVPAIISILAMDPPAPVTGVRFVRSASAPLPRAALERFERAFGIPVVETYGMTEAASMITANPVDGVRKPGSAGRPAGTEVRVVTVSDLGAVTPCGIREGGIREGGIREGGTGEVGRVQIRGAGVITSYASGGRPGVISPDGWLDTGDLGYLDSDGYLFLVGRSDDVINRGGEKIYPREIEEFLLTQPYVKSAAVVGVPDDVLGERPVAWIVPAGPGGPDVAARDLETRLRDACAAVLPRPKQPKEYFVVAEMPLGPTGKIARRRLKEQAVAGDRARADDRARVNQALPR